MLVGGGIQQIYFDRTNLPDLAPFSQFKLPTIGHIYDVNGRPLVEMASEYRQITRYEEIPPLVRDATLAAEDKNFFAHNGIDYSGFARVLHKLRGQGFAGASDEDGAPRLERTAEAAGKDRALAIKALVEAGECYRKMGDAEAKKLFERVIRNYPEQKEAVAVARERMGTGIVIAANLAPSRRIWTAPEKADFYGRVAPDGNQLPYTSWTDNGNLYIHDFVTGADRRLTDTADGNAYAEEAAVSRDGKLLAYTWFGGKPGSIELRIVGLPASGMPHPRTLVANPEFKWIFPYQWSPDGKSIVAVITHNDRTAQLATISAEDGAVHPLKSVDWRVPNNVCFSPDGKYLAYDTPADDPTGQHDIFVIAVDGSHEAPDCGASEPRLSYWLGAGWTAIGFRQRPHGRDEPLGDRNSRRKTSRTSRTAKERLWRPYPSRYVNLGRALFGSVRPGCCAARDPDCGF